MSMQYLPPALKAGDVRIIELTLDNCVVGEGDILTVSYTAGAVTAADGSIAGKLLIHACGKPCDAVFNSQITDPGDGSCGR